MAKNRRPSIKKRYNSHVFASTACLGRRFFRIAFLGRHYCLVPRSVTAALTDSLTDSPKQTRLVFCVSKENKHCEGANE